MEMRLDGPHIAVFIDFENVATSAESNFGAFDVTAVTDLLRSRGRLLIKRAYGDWGRFHRYRRAMLENGVDLFQLYSVGIQHKNRADVRLAIDALEAVFTRPNIDVYAIVSGDSDFTELVHKLRDYGKYTIGIGLHSATSDLLRRACDEFIFYETLVTEELGDIADELQLPDPRDLLRRALVAAEQKGESPVFAGRLKQIMLNLDSSFNEANYGFQQFRAFLEAQQDMVTVQEQEMQLYVSLRATPRGNGNLHPGSSETVPPPVAKTYADPAQRYRTFFRDAGLRVVDPATREQLIADFLATVAGEDTRLSLAGAADLLKDWYDAENALTQKIAVPDVMRLLLLGGALTFAGSQASGDAPLTDAGLLNATEVAKACDAVYVWRLIESGFPWEPVHLAPVLYGSGATPERIEALCGYLERRGLIACEGPGYRVAPARIEHLVQRPALAVAIANLARVMLPPGEPTSVGTAEALFREASDLRQKDFAGSAQRYLQAARIQLDNLMAGSTPVAVAGAGIAGAGLDDLKWYLASYCSVKAGHAFVTGNYAEAVPFYVAFFSLAQEADSVWPRIERLVNPMASYYFAIAGKRLGESVPPNLGRSMAAQIALRIHNHPNLQVGQAWEELIRRLAGVNLGMIRQTYRELAGQIDPVAGVRGEPGGEAVARVERTRAFVADVIAEWEKQPQL